MPATTIVGIADRSPMTKRAKMMTPSDGTAAVMAQKTQQPRVETT